MHKKEKETLASYLFLASDYLICICFLLKTHGRNAWDEIPKQKNRHNTYLPLGTAPATQA